MEHEVQARTGAQGRSTGIAVFFWRFRALVSGLRRAQTRAMGIAAAAQATARACAFVAAVAIGFVGCMFDSEPVAGDAGTLEQVNGGNRICVHRECKNKPYAAVDAGDVLELEPGNAGAGGNVSVPSSVDAGDVLEQPDGSIEPIKQGPSDAGPLERDATVVNTNDAGPLEQPDASTSPPEPVLCTAMCMDGTFKCPSSSAPSGYACRSWPPCYCTPDGGT